MLTAYEAKRQTRNLESHRQELIERTDDLILQAAHAGMRQISIKYGGRSDNDDLNEHYTKQGFKVEQTISPYNELRIYW